MDELVIKNAQLGLTFHKVNWNGEDVVWGDDMRDALRWGRTVDMVRGLKEGVEYHKVLVSDLKSKGLNLDRYGQRGRNTVYGFLITRQGVARLIATRRPHYIDDNPELAQWLDSLQDWIFGEVLPEVLSTGSYVSNRFPTTNRQIRGVLDFLTDSGRQPMNRPTITKPPSKPLPVPEKKGRREFTVRLGTNVPRGVWKKWKTLCMEENKTSNDYLAELVKQEIAKRSK